MAQSQMFWPLKKLSASAARRPAAARENTACVISVARYVIPSFLGRRFGAAEARLELHHISE